MDNGDVSRVLNEMADVMELTGGNAFKVRAYRQAAQFIELLPTPVSELWRQGRLTELPSIGERMAGHIQELLETGHFHDHDVLCAAVPSGLLEVLKVEGVGPKTVSLAWRQLKVQDLAAFEQACHDGTLEALPRMGEKRVQAVLAAIERHRARKGRVALYHALPVAEAIAERLRGVRGVVQAEVAGSLRRRKDLIGDIDLLVGATDADAAVRAFASAPEVEVVAAAGTTKCTARLHNGLQADLRVVPPESFGAALHYFTGSKAHGIEVRTRALKRGLKLSEYGVFDREGHRLGGATEEEVYRAVGLPFIAPELREGQGEVQAAAEGRLPRLVEEGDLRGDLHVHSTASSDGRSGLDELRDEAALHGRAYLAVTDHTRSRPLGLTAEGALENAAKIRAASRGGVTLLAGLEVDILADGSLDLPDEVLEKLDVVVASVHARLNDPPEQMTRRLLRAVKSGRVDVIGHPTGRQLGMRDAYGFDADAVFRAAREHGVALELNATPDRLDLDDVHARAAKAAGVKLVISSDAHHASQLGNLRWGVWMARRGWLTRDDVLNALPLDALKMRLYGARHGPRRKRVA
jgi:DNA polymerase (family 10)